MNHHRIACLVASVALAACSGSPTDRPDAQWDPDAPGRPDTRQPDAGEGTDVVIVDDFAGPMPTPLDIGPIVTAPTPPPPLTGGTLLVLQDGTHAIAADPDRDAVYVIDLATHAVAGTVHLSPGDEPQRAVEDDAHQVHLVLRGPGVIATIDPATATITARRSVCGTPRGIAFDTTAHTLEVVCSDGQWITLPASGGEPTRSVMVAPDLRDIVIRTDDVVISTFRRGDVLVVGRDGVVQSTLSPQDPPIRTPAPPTGGPPIDQHEIAWRTRVLPDGSIVVLHQLASTAPISTTPSGYGGLGCGAGIAHPAMTVFAPGATTAMPTSVAGTLSVDMAVSPDGESIAIAVPGNTMGRGGMAGVEVYPRAVVAQGVAAPCPMMPAVSLTPSGQPIAIAYAPDGHLLVQNREPAVLDIADSAGTISYSIPLSRESRADSGYALFHGNAGANIACASCHPEGGDDGHVWSFADFGPRRTQSMRGGVLATAPFHWNGDMTDFDVLATSVMGERMGGGHFDPAYAPILAQYVDHIPSLANPPPVDTSAVDRGRALFENGYVGCTGCHAGPLLTNNASVDVGTGGAFQVPSLRGVRWRAPYMHNGCAATLRDRFTAPCGGGEMHGHTDGLAAGQVDDLVAYLTTL